MTTFPTTDPVRARVDIEMGDIRVVAGAAGETVVDVVPTDPSSEKDRRAADATRVTCSDDRLEVIGPRRNALIGPSRKSGSIQVSIALPAGSALEARTSMGSIVTDGALGEVSAKTSMGDVQLQDATSADLKSGFGDVTARHVAGDVRCSTGSGAISIDRVDGMALVKNSNGDTWLGVGGSTTRVKSANGDITVERAPGDVMATTALGNVSVGSAERGALMLRTSAGRIGLGIPHGTAARLDLRTGYGTVRNELESSDGPVAGDRTVDVDAQTSAGDIDVVRAIVNDA
jgi:DUF4097 and DUF4098 domain-containing protein YvlB